VKEPILAAIGGRAIGGTIAMKGEAVNHIAFGNGRIETAGVIGDKLGRLYDASNMKTYDVVDGCAIIPVEGTLVHKGGWLGAYSGETSYQGLQTQVARAMADESVKGVAFEIDSYGGEVSGAFETSDMIFALSQVKPTMAILSDCAYSAGYLMASACRQIVVPEAGGAGSIGVITMHVDYSKALDEEGIKVTMLAAGAHKADGNPYEPLPADVAARIMANVETSRQAFAGRVGLYRGARCTTRTIFFNTRRIVGW
jgi:ClpP class serine protease